MPPAPPATAGPDAEWTYHQVAGAVCRDGSPAGYYVRRGSAPNLLIFLNGGGACYDDFFCGLNPANVNETLEGETLLDAAASDLTSWISPVAQTPPEGGLLSRDPRNPVRDYSMVFVPYCTGDVFAGTTPNSKMVTSTTLPPQHFVGYTNIGLFYEDFDASLRASKSVMLAGASGGSFGTLLNYDRTATFFADSDVFALADSGFAFRDRYLEPCLQKIWRELWNLDKILPADCKGCFNADGGGLAEGLGGYLFKEKYKGKVLGGAVSSAQDQVMKLFFSSGLDNCQRDSQTDALFSAIGLTSYPRNRYPEGLDDFIENVAGRDQMGSYLIDGDRHQHVLRTRFFQENGVGVSIADWLGDLLAGEAAHVR